MLLRRDPFADPDALIRRVYSYAAFRLGDGPDAEDATSATLERGLKYKRSYNVRSGSPEAWMLGIARRVVDDYLATPRRRHLIEPDEARAADMWSLAIDRLALRDGMAGLSQSDRDILALRYGADLGVSEMAVILDMRKNTVEVSLHRAISRLRLSMDADLPHQETAHG